MVIRQEKEITGINVEKEANHIYLQVLWFYWWKILMNPQNSILISEFNKDRRAIRKKSTAFLNTSNEKYQNEI